MSLHIYDKGKGAKREIRFEANCLMSPGSSEEEFVDTILDLMLEAKAKFTTRWKVTHAKIVTVFEDKQRHDVYYYTLKIICDTDDTHALANFIHDSFPTCEGFKFKSSSQILWQHPDYIDRVRNLMKFRRYDSNKFNDDDDD